MNNLKTIPTKTLNQIKEEYFSLIRGKEIKVDITECFRMTMPVVVGWHEDTNAGIKYSEDVIDKLFPSSYTRIENKIESETKKFLGPLNKKIKTFIKKTETLSKKTKTDNDDLWDWLWNEQAKANL